MRAGDCFGPEIAQALTVTSLIIAMRMLRVVQMFDGMKPIVHVHRTALIFMEFSMTITNKLILHYMLIAAYCSHPDIRFIITEMAKLRSGKNTKFYANKQSEQNKNKLKPSFKPKEFSVKLKKLSKSEIDCLLNPHKRYSLGNGRIQNTANEQNKTVQLNTKTKTISCITANVIWKNIANGSEALYPLDLVLAKMGSSRPWPARINSIYRVGNVLKCYVLFFGTMQIGSVPRSQCVRVSDCHTYLINAIREIKSKFKWYLDYEKISATQDIQRTISIIKLTQVQQFLLALRDMERLQGVPYDLSMVK